MRDLHGIVSQLFKYQGVVLGLFVILAPVSARADVVADAQAPANQRPVILESGNGVPVVNITTPSAAGVSRNEFSQFDVDPNGVILNNGRTDSNTQLAGWVQANPWLASGSARIILNEINSSDPSRLNGYVEVAGGRAQVVIANPAGISCDGCGFINASRATLSTGDPLLSGGNLTGYQVQQGQISITGAGLDNSTGYTDLIGQAVQINAGIWSQQLNVAGGGGTVNAGVTAATDNGSAAPTVAIDVSQLGGMYAGSIHLIGNQAGVGVRNAGQIGVGAGEVTLTADGRIENTGVVNGGTTVISADTLDNSGSGRIYGDQVAIGATTVNNLGDGTTAPVIAAREQLDIGATTINNREHALIHSGGDMAIGGALDNNQRATGQGEYLHNASATIEAMGNLDLAVRQISNTDEHLETEEVLIDSQDIREFRGDGSQNRYTGDEVRYIRHDQSRDLRTPDGTYDVYYEYNYTRQVYETQVTQADPARIVAGGDITLQTDQLDNENSRIMAGGDITGTAHNIVNTSAPGYITYVDNGRVTRFRRVEEDDAGGTKSHWEQRSSTSGYRPADTLIAHPLNLASSDSDASIPGSNMPDSALFTTNPAAPNGYLIETDPQFTDYREWISSDYMLALLAVDPATTQMRLGDGFYEQQLVREQLAKLTGQRFLEDFSDDEAQYIALMEAGVTFAREHNLRPGIALSPEQVGQLTSDIVWLVEEQRTLPDGTVANVLVPRVYVMVRDDGINSQGGLVAANNIRLEMSGDLDNSGQLVTRQITAITAQNINNLGGTLQSADVQLNAHNDINNSGSIRAQDSLALNAGHDINVVSTTRTQTGTQGTRTNIDRIAGLYVNSGSLIANAGHNINLTGAVIENNTLTLDGERLGNTALRAGNDFMLNSIQESETQRIVWDAHNQLYDANSRAVGSVVSARGGLSIMAGRDVTMTTAQVNSSQGALQVTAGRNIAIDAGHNESELLSTHRYKSQSGTFSNATTTTRIHRTSTSSVASTLSADQVSVIAGRDLSVTGSNVISDSGTLLTAGNNVTIAAATDTLSESHYTKTKKSGVSTSGASLSVGSQSQKMNSDSTRQLASGSTIASLGGSVTVAAGKHYQQTGSAVLAPTGDILIAAQSVDIVEAHHEMRNTTKTETKQSGLTLSLSTPVVDTLNTTDRMYGASKQTDDKRMQALAAASAGLSAYNTYTNPTGFKVSASVGSSKTKSVSRSHSSTVAGSTVSAGNNVIISAQGAQLASDITVRGSQIKGGNQIHLLAEDEVKLLAAANHSEHQSRNSSSSGAVGVSAGDKGVITADISGSKGKGHSNGSDTTWSNTQVEAGNLLVIDSGGDTTLRGAVARAEQVTTRIGGDLLIESLQDESRYDSKQKSTGGSLSVGATSISGTIDLSGSRIRSDYASVQEQSGIFAGDGGFDVAVQGHTTLIGGAIASTQAAVDGERNQFQSDNGITLQDIDNRAEYDARGYALSAGVGSGAQNHPGKPSGSAGYAEDSDSAHSVTRAGISGVAGNTQVRTGDASTGIDPIFDANRVQRELDAHIAITQEFGKQAPQAWANYAVQQQREALARGDIETALKWAEGGEYRIAGHLALGAIGGDLAGATGALISAGVMPQLDGLLKDPSLPTPVQQALGMVTSATLGAIAGAQGAATAFNIDTNNRQLHPDEVKWLLEHADAFAEKQGISPEEALQRLAQQALREVDYLWRAQLSDGDDDAAKQFLLTDTTFTNDIGNAQKLFTAEGQQLLRPEMYLDVADVNFYRQYAQVGVSRPLGEGLRKELQDSGVAMKDGAIDLVQLTVDNPGLVLDALWEALRNTPQAMVDGVQEAGAALGEGSAVLLNDDIQQKLNALYGQDVGAYQQTLLALRTLGTIVGTVTAGKAGGEVLDQTTDVLDKATEAAARKLDEISEQVAEQTLLRHAGLVDSDGVPILDMKQLTNEQKAVLGDLFGGDTVQRIVPDGEKIARTPGVGETGIDDIYRVNRPDVDYVIIEYKFVGDFSTNGSSRLKNTADGRQGSESWIGGSSRIENAVGGLNDEALNVRNALESGRVESWVVTTRPDGSTAVQVLDGVGRPKPIDTSSIIVPTINLPGAMP